MSALVLYLVVAIGTVVLWHRRVQPIGAVAAIVVVLLPLCFTGRALLTGRIYAPVDLPFMSEPLGDYKADYGVGPVHNGNLSDLYCQIIPWRKAVRWAIAQGEWPLWNPFMLSGDILAQAAQPAPYDPVNLVALTIPMAPSLTFGAAMTFFLAGFFTFAFARLLGLSDLASLVAAAGFMFAAMLAFFVGWPLARAWSYMPLVLAGVRLVVRDRDVRAAAVLTSGFVLVIFAGHPESILHVVFVGALYGVFELLSSRAAVDPSTPLLMTRPLIRLRHLLPKKRGEGSRWTAWREILFPAFGEKVPKADEGTCHHIFTGVSRRSPLGMTRPIALSVLAGVLALLLTAIFLLPFLEAVPQTVESRVRETYADTNFITVPAEIIKRAGATLFPWFGGGPENDNYTSLWTPHSARTGGVILALASVAVIVARGRRETWFFAVLALFCLCAALDAPPVAHLLHELPLFDIALNERLAFAAAFALAMLAGIAVDAMTAAEGGRRHTNAAITLIAIAAGLAVGTWLLWDWQIAVGVRPELIRKLAAAELIPLLVIAALCFRRSRFVAPAVLALLLVQRTLEDGWLYPSLPEHMFYPPVPVLEAIPRTHDEPFRIAATHFALIPATAAMYELEDVRGYEAMTFKRLADTYPFWAVPQPVSFNAIPDLRRPFLSLANVRYALSPNEPNPPEGWRNIVTDRNTSLFENTRVLPRAFIPRRVRYEGRDAKVLHEMRTATDFSDLAWILAPEVGPHEIGNGPGKLTLKQTGTTLDINADMQGDGWVVISNSAWKGWRAYLNGRRVNTHFANHAFLGVFVPQGQHHLRLVYLPTGFTRGRAISFVTAGALAAWAALRAWRRRRATRHTPATSD